MTFWQFSISQHPANAADANTTAPGGLFGQKQENLPRGPKKVPISPSFPSNHHRDENCPPGAPGGLLTPFSSMVVI